MQARVISYDRFIHSEEYKREFFIALFPYATDIESKKQAMHDITKIIMEFKPTFLGSDLSVLMTETGLFNLIYHYLSRNGFKIEASLFQYRMFLRPEASVKDFEEWKKKCAIIRAGDTRMKEAVENYDKDLKESKWSAASMAFAIAAKKRKRANKGLLMNFFTLVRRDVDIADEINPDELVLFLNTLKEEITSIPDGSRFQLAIQTGVHWTACDLIIENKKPTFFLLDAANYYDTLRYIDNAINKIFPGARIYCYIPDVLSQDEKTGETRLRQIQFDSESCGLFTLDHLFHLAKIDTFKILAAAGLKSSKMNPEYFRFGPEQCPEELAFIFRNVQSISVLKSLPEKLKSRIINLKEEYLFESALRTAEKDKDRVRINPILSKRQGFAKDTIEFLHDKSTEFKTEILTSATGINFLKKGIYHKSLLTKPVLRTSKKIINQLRYQISVYIVELLNIHKGTPRHLLPKDLLILKAIKSQLSMEDMSYQDALSILNKEKDKLSKPIFASLECFYNLIKVNTHNQQLRDKAIFSEVKSYGGTPQKQNDLALDIKNIFSLFDEFGVEDDKLYLYVLKNIDKIPVWKKALLHWKKTEPALYYNSSINAALCEKLINNPSDFDEDEFHWLLSCYDRNFERLEEHGVKLDTESFDILFGDELFRYDRDRFQMIRQMGLAIKEYGPEIGKYYVKGIVLWAEQCIQRREQYLIEDGYSYQVPRIAMDLMKQATPSVATSTSSFFAFKEPSLTLVGAQKLQGQMPISHVL